ncbi:hypothetical protein [Nitrolancea hollandica]|uniref:Uncharacterized protein n=1 Tax=Nitrolancea hollandica Lb TaxID=1129897 RepID=I4EGR9_9BACT|nr:hypothetical protein [Nitrolancea hollandica]CCF83881.1 hypothetical protein NITHO_280024 [Nitrolancea hollandica Lb]
MERAVVALVVFSGRIGQMDRQSPVGEVVFHQGLEATGLAMVASILPLSGLVPTRNSPVVPLNFSREASVRAKTQQIND